MPHLMLYVTLVLVGIASVLFILWLVLLGSLLHRIQRKYPGYYKKLGRPYTWFTATDVSLTHGGLTGKRAKAWRKFAWRLQKGWPPAFPKDRISRALGTMYRGAVRFWMAYVVMCLLLVVPFDVLATLSNWQSTHSKTSATKQADDITHAGPNSYTATSAGAPTPTPSTETPPPTLVTTDTGEVDFSANQTNNTQPSAPKEPTLTRADLTSSLRSVAPVGQKRSTKQAVCEQLIVEETPASDLGPSPNQICTDGNLSTYSTY